MIYTAQEQKAPSKKNPTKTRDITPPLQKRHKHDYQYWLAEPYNSARGETALWVAVITQAVMDALSKSANPETLYHKREAIYWLTENSKDFVAVCLNAGLDPDYVRKKAKRAINCPTPWRAEPGKGKRYTERKAYREQLRKKNTPHHRINEETPPATVISYSNVAA